MSSQFSSIGALLRWRASQHPERPAFTFLLDGDEQESRLTYRELDERARAIAGSLQSLGHFERALLLYPAGPEFVTAFFGCLYAGITAVPATLPGRRGLSRLESIARDCGATIALTTREQQAALAGIAGMAALRCVATDAPSGGQPAEWHEPDVNDESPAFLQYTSGSTGQPKGVMVSHANVMHNERALQHAFGMTGQSVVVGWLPLFHDMGLIGTVLQPVFAGAHAVLMPPAAFLQRPARWLEAITRYRATISGGPNFAYDLCLRRITPEQRAGLDLSSWEKAFNGSEPVRPETLERFTEVFEPHGFRHRAHYPCYGLAEATLFVAGRALPGPPTLLPLDAAALENGEVVPGADASSITTLVSSGHPGEDQQLRIVDPQTLEPSAEGSVGEIWVSSPSVALGYWNQPDLTRETFRASLPDSPARYLRTGDLGFVHRGELFVTGRLKDLIIVRGRNHYPQDIERTVEASHRALRPAGAAFTAETDGQSRLVVVQEVERAHLRRLAEPGAAAEVIRAVRRAVSEEHELQVHDVILVRPASIPRTTSGKIQRGACREQHLAGTLATVITSEARDARAAPVETAGSQQEALEQQLRERVAGVLRVSPAEVDAQQDLSTLGFDSLQVIELKHHLESSHSVEISVEQFFEGLTLRQLARQILTGTPPRPPRTPAPPARAKRPAPASPPDPAEPPAPSNTLQFSLLYFSSDATGPGDDRYRLLIEGATFADRNDFTAVWIPERHFHPFGGLYPNPSVLAGALAMVTRRLRLRAGSVVLPLHDPVRVAEEWSVVDNLSNGRVDLAFAAGWNPQDFVLAPQHYKQRHEVFHAGMQTVRTLWEGGTITRHDGTNHPRTIGIHPTPRQRDLHHWITCSGGHERFAEAGAAGANVLTALLFQTEDELAEKIAVYRAARAEHGLDPHGGHVTLMLHTFLGNDPAEVREQVRGPFTEYLRSSVSLWRQASRNLDELSDREQQDVLAFAFERYFQTAALFGTPQTALPRVRRLQELGVNEIACLIDFGVQSDAVLSALEPLNQLRELAQAHPHHAAEERQALNPEQAQELLGRLDELSDEEVEALLGDLSRDGG